MPSHIVAAIDAYQLPAGGNKRDRIAAPAEALALVQALPTSEDRALWATAFFAGLRLGELAPLDWSDVELVARTIRVRRAGSAAVAASLLDDYLDKQLAR